LNPRYISECSRSAAEVCRSILREFINKFVEIGNVEPVAR
jgi:hypothetical protein